jgi:predicted lipoprotein with Yx(FWY)xxD motif
MKPSLRRVVPFLLAAAVLLALLAPASAAPDAKPLVSKLRAPNLGATVLARPNKQALYYWNRERDGKVRCVGACAEAWPPYFVGKDRVIPRKIKGYQGTFGKVRRPDGRYQLTYNRLPLYTYAHERPGVVLCDDVDGWFAIRL